MSKIIFILFTIMSIGSVFLCSNAFIDIYILPKWLFFVGGLAGISIVYGVYMIRENGKEKLLQYEPICIVITLVCVFQSCLGIMQYYGYCGVGTTYKVVGTFDNPAGFASCICVGLPFFMYIFSFRKFYHVFMLGIVAFAILLSGSRTGVLTLGIIGGWRFFKSSYSLYLKIVFTVVFICIVLYLILECKTDSSVGRLFIWKCCWEMIKDNPWGYGIGAFRSHYMLYQAQYFRTYPSSSNMMLADNISHPLNEIVLLLVQFGILGFVLLLLILLVLVYCYFRSPSKLSECAVGALTSIFIWSMFSYPFHYPFIWLIGGLAIGILLRHMYSKVKIFNKLRRIGGGILLTIGLFVFSELCIRVNKEMMWKDSLCSTENSTLILECYKSLMDYFEKDPYFLYNYAVVLYNQGYYEECVCIANKCKKYWSDYDLEILLAEAYSKVNNMSLALQHYELAFYMCPVRFLPLYGMLHIYQQKGDLEKVHLLAQLIVDKPIKISSFFIDKVKKEALMILNDK